MTLNSLLATGAFLLLAVITWYLVQTLRQAQRTALAVEQLIAGTRPGIEEASDRLRSVLGRADKLLATMEQRGVGSVVGVIAQAASGWNSASRRPTSRMVQAMSLLSALALGLERAWAIITSKKPTQPRNESAPEGGMHE